MPTAVVGLRKVELRKSQKKKNHTVSNGNFGTSFREKGYEILNTQRTIKVHVHLTAALTL